MEEESVAPENVSMKIKKILFVVKIMECLEKKHHQKDEKNILKILSERGYYIEKKYWRG